MTRANRRRRCKREETARQVRVYRVREDRKVRLASWTGQVRSSRQAGMTRPGSQANRQRYARTPVRPPTRIPVGMCHSLAQASSAQRSKASGSLPPASAWTYRDRELTIRDCRAPSTKVFVCLIDCFVARGYSKIFSDGTRKSPRFGGARLRFLLVSGVSRCEGRYITKRMLARNSFSPSAATQLLGGPR